MDDLEPERRSFVLRAAVFVANAFLIVFAAGSVFSLLDSAVLHTATATTGPMFVALALLGFAMLLLMFVTIILLIFVPHLPKIVLLPPIAVLIWELVGAPPLGWSMSDAASQIPMDAIALGVAALSFVLSKLTTGGWLLKAENLPHKSHLVLRTLIALPVFVVVMALTLGGILVGGGIAVIQEQTKDYLHFGPSSVQVRETVLRKGDKVVHLVAMVHFGEPQFYRELFASIPPGALILAEGISDRNRVLTNGLNYNNAAGALGLQSQDIFQQLLKEKGRVSEPTPDVPSSASNGQKPVPAPVPAPAPAPAAPPAAPGPDVIRADVDASDFSPVTIRFLQRVGDVYASHSMSEAMDKLTKVGNEFTDADMNQIWDDILYKRNTKVLSEFDKALPKYQVIYIPWGAEHMRDLEAGLTDRGFKIESTRLIPLARYDTIFSGLSRLGR